VAFSHAGQQRDDGSEPVGWRVHFEHHAAPGLEHTAEEQCDVLDPAAARPGSSSASRLA
jgi:hypothetical protein